MKNDFLDYLVHYGIEGQKWGVRRFQNEDGSLTPAGKERYYGNSDREKMFKEATSGKNVTTNTSGVTTSLSDNKKYVSHILTNKESLSDAISFVKKQSEALINVDNTAYSTREKEYGDIIKNKGIREEIVNSLYNSYVKKHGSSEKEGSDLTDLDWDLRDEMDAELSKHLPESNKMLSDLETGISTYFDNIKVITEDIVGEYGSTLVKNTQGYKDSYEDLVYHTLLAESDSRYWRYVNNHMEDFDEGENSYAARDELWAQLTEKLLKAGYK